MRSEGPRNSFASSYGGFDVVSVSRTAHPNIRSTCSFLIEKHKSLAPSEEMFFTEIAFDQEICILLAGLAQTLLTWYFQCES